MREIKFRAWNDRTKSFVIPEDGYSINLYGDLIHNGVFARIGGEYTLMQYTGIKDNNGVEIYEGDIVRYNNGKLGFYEYSEPNVSFAIRVKEEEYSGDMIIESMLDGWHNFNVEVIGNIYEHGHLLENENPELLNEK